MKRHLYLLLVVFATLTACDSKISIDGKKVIAHVISEPITIETTDTSATITTTKPHIVVNGVKEQEATIYMEYWVEGDESTKKSVNTFAENSLTITFTLENLLPSTTYYAHFAVGNSAYGEKKGDIFTFTTEEHVPVASMTYEAEVDAKGLMATANLTNVAYLVDGANSDIHVIRVEYKRTSAEEWISHEFQGSAIKNGTLAVELPFDGEDYLEENRNYFLRFTLYPQSGDYKPLTSEDIEFKTTFAEVTANIATPTLSLQSNSIKASVENIEVFYDGIPAEEYKDGTPVKYYFYYRVKGSNEWSKTEVTSTNGDISATIEAQEGNTYEVKALIVAGGMQKVRESAMAEINVPKSETPTPPVPPVTGDADTKAIAGEWHLTEWRGTAPAFDVYLSISEDGVVTLWQRIESRLWETFYSTVGFDGSIIAGKYTDGVAWAASYSVTIDGDTMTWTNTADKTEVSIYTRCTLPDFTNPDIRTYAAEDRRFL